MGRTERVARAICRACGLDPDSKGADGDARWHYHERLAQAALAAADEWEPIETARESTVPGRFEGLICAIRLADGTPYFSDIYHSWKNPDGTWARWPHDFPPTHWRPLPSAPGVG